MAYLFLLRDTPALASGPNFAHPTSCRLFIKYSAQRSQAAIIVSVSAHTHASDTPQVFDLTYDASNLAVGTFLGPIPNERELKPDQLSGIARRPNVSAFKVLSLALHTPCTVRCAPSTGTFAPKLGHIAAFRALGNLASSTEVRIVFDHNWIQHHHYAALHSLINRPDKLAGIPFSSYPGNLTRLVDWTAFGPVCEHPPEELPRYDQVPAKRPRPTSSTGSSVLPPFKRDRVTSPKPNSPEPSSPDCGSPTEKATTTTESPSPSPRRSPAPGPTAPFPQQGPNAILEELLPGVLEKMMPEFLARAFSVPLTSSDHHTAASIGSRIAARISSDVKACLAPLQAQAIEDSCVSAVKQMSGDFIQKVSSEKLKEVLQDVLDQGFSMRQDADAIFFEELDAHKLDVTIAKDEGLDEIRHELDKKREELVAEAEEVVARTGADVERLADQSYKTLRENSSVLARQRPPTIPRYRSASLPL